MVPSPSIGRVSKYNANGKLGPPKRDLPKEKFIVQYDTTITDWHGNDHDVTVTQIRERYQRDLIPPPGEELSVATDTNGEVHIVSKLMVFGQNQEIEKLLINLFLELFTGCDVYDANSTRIITAPITRVNWKILPSGNIPWDQRRIQILPIIKSVSKRYAGIIEGRMEKLNSYSPRTVAVGLGGFSDYLAFEYPAKNLCILESIRPLNATYIFGNNWSSMSRLTKTQVITGQLAIRRLSHTKGWSEQIEDLLK